MQPTPILPTGLATPEARRLLALHGPNEIADRESSGLRDTLKGIAREPMFLLLLAAAAIYLVLGDLGEGLLLAFFALVTVGLVFGQERRSARALDALRSLAAPQVRAWRDGQVVSIPARELVPGDLFLLGEGERVAADGVLLEAASIAVDESLLTGESVPVRKRAFDPAQDDEDAAAAPGGDDQPRLFAGTLVVAGHGLARVTATGRTTQMGRIGASLAAIDNAPPPLSRQLKRLVRVLAVAALAASGFLVLWHGLRGGHWLDGVLSGIALGMAMLPEEFPMALAVFLALGAWRMARAKVLVRRPAVVEALGSATVLAVDKTGTLTENRMRVVRLLAPDGAADLDIDFRTPTGDVPEPLHQLLEFAALASTRGGIDPMDRAVLESADQALAGTEHLHPDWRLERDFPLSPELLAFSQHWTDARGAHWIAAKGAPEAIFDLCHLDAPAIARFHAHVQAMAVAGLRVLAVAAAPVDAARPLQHPHDADFRPLGLLGFEDPLREDVPDAVQTARGAGIAVAMITGDHAATALAIARRAGIDTNAGALTGAELEDMDDAALADALREVRVFARVSPQQKLLLVQALQRNGHTVAMTGDGVNDAPALKAAEVGIAMGVRGTDVAREAAGLVLLDEDFGRIVTGVRMGRRIFDNLRKVMTYIFAIHVPVAGLALLPVLFGLPPLLLPAHVVLTEMVIDPICSLAFENAPEDPQLMERPPRAPDAGLVNARLVLQALLQGGALLLATLAIYLVALRLGRTVDVARTLAVLGLTFGNLWLVAANLAAGVGLRAALLRRSALPFWGIALLATAVLALALLWEPARELLKFGLPTPGDLAVALGVCAVAVVVGAALSSLVPTRSRGQAQAA